MTTLVNAIKVSTELSQIQPERKNQPEVQSVEEPAGDQIVVQDAMLGQLTQLVQLLTWQVQKITEKHTPKKKFP